MSGRGTSTSPREKSASPRRAAIRGGAGDLWDDISVEVTPRGVAAVRLDASGRQAHLPRSESGEETADGAAAFADDARAIAGLADDARAIATLAADPPPADRLATDAVRQLREYLRGDRTDFELPLDLTGVTPFRRRVFEALLDVPFGSTVSYKELARRVDCKSARAVGQAVGSNPIAVIVPCHRVVTSDGRLGGYSGGLSRKVALLGIEGIEAGSDSFSSRIVPAA